MTRDQARISRFGRRARWLIPVGILCGLLLIAVGFEGWRLVDALTRAEKTAIVPLPTRSSGVATTNFGEQTADNASSSDPFKGSDAHPDNNAEASGQKPPKSATEPTRVTNVMVTPTPNHASSSATTAPEGTDQTPAGQTSRNQDEEQTSGDDTSHFDVVKQVIGAGIDTGDPGKSSVWEGKTSLNVLVVGIDRRPEGGDQNADVIIIARVDLLTGRVAAVSIPRDLLVTVPGIGEDKINSAYNYGIQSDPTNDVAGIAKVRDTIEDVFGIPIDGYALVDFNGFQRVIDAIDGIDVDVPREIVDPAYPTADGGTETITFHAGLQHMDGARALQYVRTRHADSDDGRRERQMQVLQALFEKGKRLTSLPKAERLILAAGSAVQTSFPLDQQLVLARIAYKMDPSDIRWSSLTPPILSPGTTANGAWVYVGDMNQIIAFIQDGLITDPDRYADATPTG